MMNLKGKMVKIRFKKYFEEQSHWIMVGKVLDVTEGWIMVEGKGIIVCVNQAGMDTKIDEEPRVLVVPSSNIAHIRILPDSFELKTISIEQRKGRDFIKVKGGPDTSIGEQF